MSEMVKALSMALNRPKGPPPMACCPRCPGEVPLISTFLFSGAEFYCLDCGAQVGFVNPKAAEETPKLTANYEARKREWDENVVSLRGDRAAQLAWLEERRTTQSIKEQ